MAFARRVLVLLCVISGLLSRAFSDHPTLKKDNNCPKGWTRLNCNCYIYQDEKRTFADAESVCNIIGGNLVSIHNSVENFFVRELIREGTVEPDTSWIGLHDAISQTGDFIWTDGTIEDFLAFNLDEPDSGGDCVEIVDSDGCWADTACTDMLTYVCIREVQFW
ncbi:lithostathine-1-alpha-like [Corythoichthys intestinalis]|uniref:lithostathine-1-alpha-like n=1 Tax=Corythoichthys intestinalis TaxID=161448 RepID=UPI0025A68BBA|nr:lithostathine-1-alpha-like [Corythoichthys intestinalis]